ncbi:MAG: S8 family serine peptidase, partial [Elusimicrobia bacterium]|nr:S8 family serine peptidase [Elusimicrobiota bacterium]
APPAAARTALEAVSKAVSTPARRAGLSVSAALARFFDGRAAMGGAEPVLNAAKEGPSRPAGLAAPSLRPSGSREEKVAAPARFHSVPSPAWAGKLGALGRFASGWTGSALLTAGGLAAAYLTGHIHAAFFAMVPLYAAFVVPSLILHEMGHAKMADHLGDPTARLQGRLGFSLRGLMTHVSPLMTVAVPLVTMAFFGLPFGGAEPVDANTRNFQRPDADMAKVALAGPAVNAGLALLGGAAAAGLAAAGVGGLAMTAAGVFVLVNVMLAVTNLLPLAPLDGHHIVRWVVADVFRSPAAADWLDAHAGVQFYALALAVIYGASTLMSWISGLSGLVMLPAVLLAGTLAAAPRASGPAMPAAPSMPESRLVLVQLDGAARPLAADIHLGAIDVNKAGGMRLFASQQTMLAAELEASGMGFNILAAYGAAPVATYRRINTTTVRVPDAELERFKADMRARGYKVYENKTLSIVKPIEDDARFAPKAAPEWGGLSMQDTLKMSTADKVHEVARARWGDPGVGLRARLAGAVLRLAGAVPVQPKVAVIDTGVDKAHPLVKPGLAAAKDIRPNGDGADDDGHGTWTFSMVLNYAPWLRAMTSYKAFANGSASTDDVLKGLTMAANDGNIIMSNSWGDDGGDPDSPDSQLVAKLASEGRVMVFAAGNNGEAGANSIGSPAIASYKDPKTGAPRVLAVAATDADGMVTDYSSKGPGSPVTKAGGKWKDYPRKPDLAEEGDNTVGAWPGGKTRAISGTSMSTPKVAGTLALLCMLFGVTDVGEKLDRVVLAVMATLRNPNAQPDASLGSGFNSVKAAYDKLVAEGMTPSVPNWAARLTLRLVGGARK